MFSGHLYIYWAQGPRESSGGTGSPDSPARLDIILAFAATKFLFCYFYFYILFPDARLFLFWFGSIGLTVNGDVNVVLFCYARWICFICFLPVMYF